MDVIRRTGHLNVGETIVFAGMIICTEIDIVDTISEEIALRVGDEEDVVPLVNALFFENKKIRGQSPP
jgi:hypothetical protein